MNHRHGEPSADSRRKFNSDATPRVYRGNTVISRVEPESQLGIHAEQTHRLLEGLSSRDRWALLPPSSYHMTIIQLLSEPVRDPAVWSAHLDTDCDLEEADEFMIAAMSELPPPTELKMWCRQGFAQNSGNVALTLEPATTQTRTALIEYRDAVAEATGVRRPDHDTYEFHVGIAYRVGQLNEAEQEELQETLTEAQRNILTRTVFVLPAPRLVFLDTIVEFHETANRRDRQEQQRRSDKPTEPPAD